MSIHLLAGPSAKSYIGSIGTKEFHMIEENGVVFELVGDSWIRRDYDLENYIDVCKKEAAPYTIFVPLHDNVIVRTMTQSSQIRNYMLSIENGMNKNFTISIDEIPFVIMTWIDFVEFLVSENEIIIYLGIEGDILSSIVSLNVFEVKDSVEIPISSKVELFRKSKSVSPKDLIIGDTIVWGGNRLTIRDINKC